MTRFSAVASCGYATLAGASEGLWVFLAGEPLRNLQQAQKHPDTQVLLLSAFFFPLSSLHHKGPDPTGGSDPAGFLLLLFHSSRKEVLPSLRLLNEQNLLLWAGGEPAAPGGPEHLPALLDPSHPDREELRKPDCITADLGLL